MSGTQRARRSCPNPQTPSRTPSLGGTPKRHAVQKCFCGAGWRGARLCHATVSRAQHPSGCGSATRNLHFGTGRDTDGSRVAADFVPRTPACQQQVPRTELTLAACFGGGRRRVWDRHPRWRRRNGVTAAATSADRSRQGSRPCSTAGSLGAIARLSDMAEPPPTMPGARPEQRPSRGDGLLWLEESETGVST